MKTMRNKKLKQKTLIRLIIQIYKCNICYTQGEEKDGSDADEATDDKEGDSGTQAENDDEKENDEKQQPEADEKGKETKVDRDEEAMLNLSYRIVSTYLGDDAEEPESNSTDDNDEAPKDDEPDQVPEINMDVSVAEPEETSSDISPGIPSIEVIDKIQVF